MKELDQYEAQQKKLEGICEKNHLVFSFRKGEYPPKLKIMPNQGMDEQLSILEAAGDEKRIPKDSYKVYFFGEGELESDTYGRFPISDVLDTKIKNIFKKMCVFWWRYFFRSVIENDLIDRRLLPQGTNVEDRPVGIEILEDDLEEPDEPSVVSTDPADVPDIDEDWEG